jgi:hypothetical protein
VDWGFVAIPLGAVVSVSTTTVMASRRPLKTTDRALVLLIGFIASLAALVFGMVAFFAAAEMACHGRYECPR